MNNQKKYLIIFVTLFPTIALASGAGDVLDWMSVQVFVAIAFFSALVFAKVNWIGKGIMIFIFLATEYLVLKLAVGLPYSDYKLVINVISIIAPTLTTIASYWALKSRFGKK